MVQPTRFGPACVDCNAIKCPTSCWSLAWAHTQGPMSKARFVLKRARKVQADFSSPLPLLPGGSDPPPTKRQKGDLSLCARKKNAVLKILTHTHESVSVLWQKVVHNHDSGLWRTQSGVESQKVFSHYLYECAKDCKGRFIASLQSKYRRESVKSKQQQSEVPLMQVAFRNLRRGEAHTVKSAKFGFFIQLALRCVYLSASSHEHLHVKHARNRARTHARYAHQCIGNTRGVCTYAAPC